MKKSAWKSLKGGRKPDGARAGWQGAEINVVRIRVRPGTGPSGTLDSPVCGGYVILVCTSCEVVDAFFAQYAGIENLGTVKVLGVNCTLHYLVDVCRRNWSFLHVF